jgi:hypothetical protein
MPMEQDSPKWPMSPILLQPGIKDTPLADCKDFLCSEDWYMPCSHAVFHLALIFKHICWYAEQGGGTSFFFLA